MLQVGQPAPLFTLFSSDKREVSLANFRGRNVVLLFFPMAFTNTCTAELCQMRDDIAQYANLNADVLAVSVDSPYSLAKFKEDQRLPFALLSDFNKEVSPAYGAFYEQYALNLRGVSKRAAFVVDGDGIVRYAEVLDNAKEVPDFEAIQKTLTSIQS